MTDIKELFLAFLRESVDDRCPRCAYYTPEKCLNGAWSIENNGAADLSLYASETCLRGLLEYYRKEKQYD